MAYRWFLCLGVAFLGATLTYSAGVENPSADVPLRTVAVTPRVRWAQDAQGRLVARGDLAVADRVVVICSHPTSAAQFDRVAQVAGGRVLRATPRTGLAVVALREGADLAAAAAACTALPFVRYAGPDRICYLRFQPNDPLLSQQTHLTPIRAREAWDIEQGSANVVIAVVDGGVDLDHPDLAGKIWSNPGEVPGNGQDDDGNGFTDDAQGWDFSPGSPNRTDTNPDPDGIDNDGDGTADDQVTHGTLVAGTAAAIGNNGVGVAGVNWGVTIMPVQVFPDDGGTPVSTVIEGIDYAIDEGADLINLSLGTDFYDGTFNAPVQRARTAGILVVTAAGNSGEQYTANQSTWQSPICNDGPTAGDNWVLALTATTDSDVKASFAASDASGRNFIDATAPGVDVFGTIYRNPAFPGLQNFYGSLDGSSFSTAQASGLAALLLSRDPTLTPDELMATIRGSADNIDALNPAYAGRLGAGRINCQAALQSLDNPPAAVTNLAAADTPLDAGGSVTLTWTKSADDGGGEADVTGYEVRRATVVGGPYESRGNVGPGIQTFQDATTDGVGYFYVVRTLEDNQQTDSGEVGPVQSVDNRANAVVNVPAGRSFLGFFVQPANQSPAALFGANPPQSLNWARYDPAAEAYRLLANNPADPFLQIQLGIGYWLKLDAPAVVQPDGFAASPGAFVTPLVPGWNQAADPFNGSVDFAGVRVLDDGQERTLAEAALLGLINPSGWRYDAQAQQYVMLNELLGETDIPTGAGFWMLAFDEIRLKIPQPSGGGLVARTRGQTEQTSEGEWDGRLVVRAGKLIDGYNFFGRHSAAPLLSSPNPPSAPGARVDLYFLGETGRSAAPIGGTRLAASFLAEEVSDMTWPFVVECSVPMAEVEVSCPDLSAVPREYQVMLTDLETGRRQLLRAQHSYRYTSGSEGGSRRFVLTVSREDDQSLTITGLTGVPTRGGATEISFRLSRTAAVGVDVFNIAGRRVRGVVAGELLQAGRASVVWDGRTDAGSRAPAGAYVMRVRGAAEDGGSAAAIAHVYLGR